MIDLDNSISGQLRERYPLAIDPYDRQRVWEALTAALSHWQLSKANHQRHLYLCRLTLDALDQCPGQTLQERWQSFETDVLPQWQAGERYRLLGNTWRYGITTLIVTRLVLPTWVTVYRCPIQQALECLPESDAIKQQAARLKQAVESLVWAKYPVKRSLAVDRGVKLMLVKGYQQLDEIREEDLFNGPNHVQYLGVGADILDGALCALGIFERTPRRNSSRRLREPNLSIADIVAKYAMPERFRPLTQLYLEAAESRLNWSRGYLQEVCQAIAVF